MGGFRFFHSVSEFKPGQGLTGSFTLDAAEEFLRDHFRDFPVMPGVLLLECLKQAASQFLTMSSPGEPERNYRLLETHEVKFGQFVRPGGELKISVRFLESRDQQHRFDGRIDVPGGKALSAILSLSPL
ncbi:MAG: hypothetical protein HY592_06600 [Candidatus Omnitrophica bacterium]|nr:hypothetical protein [Candidatus Omnitrophota bacterium]